MFKQNTKTMLISCRDRTNEFFSTANLYQEHASSNKNDNPNLKHSKSISTSTSLANIPLLTQHRKQEQLKLLDNQSNSVSSRFTRAASQISHGIFLTTQKLEDLAKLTKTNNKPFKPNLNSFSNSNFNSNSEQIQLSTVVIQEDIRTLNSEIDTLQTFVEENNSNFCVNQQINQHSSNIVNSLKLDLASATMSFQDVLKLRTEKLKKEELDRQRRKENNSVGNEKIGATRRRFGSSLRRKQKLPDRTSSKDSGEYASETDQILNGSYVQEQEQLQMGNETVSKTDSYLDSRLTSVRQIEQTVAELGQMYQRLATIVAVQDETCVRIDANVDATIMNVDQAQTHLLKYYDTISGNR